MTCLKYDATAPESPFHAWQDFCWPGQKVLRADNPCTQQNPSDPGSVVTPPAWKRGHFELQPPSVPVHETLLGAATLQKIYRGTFLSKYITQFLEMDTKQLLLCYW